MVSTYRLKLSEHLEDSTIASLVNGVAAYGNVSGTSEPREYVVEVFRQSKVRGLEELLRHNETWGFMRWSADT
jgi:hypothetical protein